MASTIIKDCGLATDTWTVYSFWKYSGTDYGVYAKYVGIPICKSNCNSMNDDAQKVTQAKKTYTRQERKNFDGVDLSN